MQKRGMPPRWFVLIGYKGEPRLAEDKKYRRLFSDLDIVICLQEILRIRSYPCKIVAVPEPLWSEK